MERKQMKKNVGYYSVEMLIFTRVKYSFIFVQMKLFILLQNNTAGF